jgi:aquaporin Z
MAMVLFVSNNMKIARYTGIIAGLLVAIYIILESPISGMSMNPARTLGSAIPAREWNTLWLYFAAPLIGMIPAGLLYEKTRGESMCAKLHHQNNKPCIFRCNYMKAQQAAIGE